MDLMPGRIRRGESQRRSGLLTPAIPLHPHLLAAAAAKHQHLTPLTHTTPNWYRITKDLAFWIGLDICQRVVWLDTNSIKWRLTPTISPAISLIINLLVFTQGVTEAVGPLEGPQQGLTESVEGPQEVEASQPPQ